MREVFFTSAKKSIYFAVCTRKLICDVPGLVRLRKLDESHSKHESFNFIYLFIYKSLQDCYITEYF